MNMQIAGILTEKNIIADNTLQVSFTVPVDFKFVPGQYITVTLPDLAEYEIREQFHDFSICSSLTDLPELSVTFRLSNSLFKQTLSNLKVGSNVIIDGPTGVFTQSKDVTKARYVAGGIGITPFYSMMRSSSVPFDLVYYNTTKESAAYLNDILKLPHVKLTSYFVKPSKEHFVVTDMDIMWYVAGPPSMVFTIRSLLNELGVKDSVIQTEEFSGYTQQSSEPMITA